MKLTLSEFFRISSTQYHLITLRLVPACVLRSFNNLFIIGFWFILYGKKNRRIVSSVCGPAAAMLILPASASYLVPPLVLFMAAKCACQVAVSLTQPLWPFPAITPARWWTQTKNSDIQTALSPQRSCSSVMSWKCGRPEMSDVPFIYTMCTLLTTPHNSSNTATLICCTL